MKPPRNNQSSLAAFTLIELLTVMAIIVILAGLILGTAGYANHKAASARTQAEIKGFDAAVNAYQVDWGAIPRSTDTDGLDARAEATGTGFPTDTYKKTSLFLFKALSGFYDMTVSPPRLWTSTAASPSRPKAYFPFKASQLVENPAAVAGAINPANVQYITDPFGQSYAYGTKAARYAESNPTDAQTYGFNPAFDIWSTAGFGTGKPYATNPTPPDKSVFWLTDWASQ